MWPAPHAQRCRSQHSAACFWTAAFAAAATIVAAPSHVAAWTELHHHHHHPSGSQQRQRAASIELSPDLLQAGKAASAPAPAPQRQSRAGLLRVAAAAACACGVCLRTESRPASAMAQLVLPSAEKLRRFDPPRDKEFDKRFAGGMNFGMRDYEEAVAANKRKHFEQFFQALPKGATIVEVGLGSFPNAPFFGMSSAPQGMDIIGVDPNDSMEQYARQNAEAAGIMDPAKKNSLRIAHGVAEALPLDTGSADGVVCTLTLCSVLDPDMALAEITRVLKPGGKFLFHEHVLSESDPKFAVQQQKMTPYQVKRADGCHLDRRTLEVIKKAGFGSVDSEYFELKDFLYLNPTVAGVATA
eukprot:TRINITY_DN7162_c0_g3_i1.p1 TRINITY_DN7162_c0_g3~~TRINITY_DN7162_c0_g3_i1.p1  ORF type:complete len:366 (+),score=75.81 TRINITY_DN7162_c0_g3_i1:32-1099(+)